MSTSRKKFIGEAEVVQTKRKDLPENHILVKLRKPGEKPVWKLLLLDKYLSSVRYCENTSQGRINASEGSNG